MGLRQGSEPYIANVGIRAVDSKRSWLNTRNYLLATLIFEICTSEISWLGAAICLEATLRSWASSGGTPSAPDPSRAFTSRATSFAAPLFAFSSRALSKLPKGSATEDGKEIWFGSRLRSSARFRLFPPTRPSSNSGSRSAHRCVVVVRETVTVFEGDLPFFELLELPVDACLHDTHMD